MKKLLTAMLAGVLILSQGCKKDSSIANLNVEKPVSNENWESKSVENLLKEVDAKYGTRYLARNSKNDEVDDVKVYYGCWFWFGMPKPDNIENGWCEKACSNSICLIEVTGTDRKAIATRDFILNTMNGTSLVKNIKEVKTVTDENGNIHYEFIR